MKTLKEPRPFCCSFLLPLSPLSRRRRVAFCAFNQQLFLSSRDFECFLTLSLSLSCKTTKKRRAMHAEKTKIFVPRIKKKSSPLVPPSTKKVVKDLTRVFSFFVSTDRQLASGLEKIRKNRDIFIEIERTAPKTTTTTPRGRTRSLTRKRRRKEKKRRKLAHLRY